MNLEQQLAQIRSQISEIDSQLLAKVGQRQALKAEYERLARGSGDIVHQPICELTLTHGSRMLCG